MMPWDRHWQDEEPEPDAWEEYEQRYAEWLDRQVEEHRDALAWRDNEPLVDGE